jgi:branched-chain amino acid transport system ATP-binding protein
MSISGITPVSSGSILFKGSPIHSLSPDEIVKRGISHVPEGRRIFPFLSVFENLRLGAFLRKDKHEIRKDIEFIFDLFPILKTRKNQNGGTLSGGEQQMLAISRAFMSKPRLLLLDEPSLGLAPLVIKQIFQIIVDLNKKKGTTIFLVEQNANLSLRISSRAYVMENGEIILSGNGLDLLKNDEVKKAYLGL